MTELQQASRIVHDPLRYSEEQIRAAIVFILRCPDSPMSDWWAATALADDDME